MLHLPVTQQRIQVALRMRGQSAADIVALSGEHHHDMVRGQYVRLRLELRDGTTFEIDSGELGEAA